MYYGWSTLKKLIYLRPRLGGTPSESVTVTGISPLLLESALHRALQSLTQYGLCTQNGTPTPAAPVGIMCNNGALTMVDDELPSAYKRVLGFSMNNNSYWEIDDFPLYGSDTLRFSFEASDACNVIGAYSGSARGNNYSLYVGTNANYLRYIDGAYNSAIDFDTRYDVEITPTGSSGLKTDSTWTAQTFTTPTNLCIGTTATSASSAKLKGKLYGNIEVVGRAKFVPCERVSDNALGYYDTIGEAFYEQDASYDGAVSLGYDGSHYSLAIVGTPEVISITASGADTQTATAPNLFSVGDYADEIEIISGAVTRKVGIYVFDGEESVSASGAGWAIGIADKIRSKVAMLCTHYPYSSATMANAPDKSIISFSSQNIGIKDSTLTSASDVKTWLGEQYAAGTPVIVVYPLAEETTEQIAPQPLNANAGTNTLSWTAAVSGKRMSAVYIKGASNNLVGSAIVGTATAG